jgi:hypothetical protein
MQLFENLPTDILRYIYEFVPTTSKLWITKKNYIKYHHLVWNMIPFDQIENYIREIVNRDNSFVFSFILKENFSRWLSFKKYQYKSTIYANYIYFLLGLCVHSESPKCRELIREKLKETGLSKNEHKKNIITKQISQKITKSLPKI